MITVRILIELWKHPLAQAAIMAIWYDSVLPGDVKLPFLCTLLL